MLICRITKYMAGETRCETRLTYYGFWSDGKWAKKSPGQAQGFIRVFS